MGDNGAFLNGVEIEFERNNDLSTPNFGTLSTSSNITEGLGQAITTLSFAPASLQLDVVNYSITARIIDPSTGEVLIFSDGSTAQEISSIQIFRDF